MTQPRTAALLVGAGGLTALAGNAARGAQVGLRVTATHSFELSIPITGLAEGEGA